MPDQKTERKNAFDGSMLFGTDRFNSKTGRRSHLDKTRHLVQQYFIDPDTGLLHERYSERRACPVCGAEEHDTLFIKDGFRHVKCPGCSFIFVNPTAMDRHRDHFFKNIYQTWTEVLQTPEQETVDRLKFRFGLDMIEKHAADRGRIADIGAGSGLFLKVARDSGWRVTGVEFNTSAVESIRRLGIEVFDRPLEDGVYPPTSLDAVSLWEVLEHINDPNALLHQVAGILRPQGLLFICVPNIEALVTRILHEKAWTFGGSSHVNFFSARTLTQLMEKHGFTLLETDTVISELGTIRNHLCYEDPYGGNARLDLDFLTPEYLYAHGLGSRVLLLCRKL